MDYLCSYDGLCWMPGLGYRPTADNGTACIIDEGYEAKWGPDPWEVLLMWFGGPDTEVVQAIPPVAQISILSSAVFYLTFIAALALIFTLKARKA